MITGMRPDPKGSPELSTITTADPVTKAYFEWASGVFLPTPEAGGYWGASLISGPAVAGLAAWALERDYGHAGFMPARFTVEFLKPAARAPTRVQTRIVRDGRRLRSVECDVLQGDGIVARATVMQYRRSQSPAGEEWMSPISFTAPPQSDCDDLMVGSDAVGWSVIGIEHQNVSRKRAFYRGPGVVAGASTSLFVRAVIVAEAAANLVTNLGTEGIGYINGDLTVSMSRLPRSQYIGVQADSHFAADGVAVGSATMFDTDGAFGTASVTALANPAARIDFAGSPRVDAPGSELFSGSAR